MKFDDRKFTKERTVLRPIGIKTPLEVGQQNGDLFELHDMAASQLKDNLRNLILTNHGERLCNSKFGANLKNIVFDLSNVENYNQLVVNAITENVEMYIPVIQINDVASDVEPEGVDKYAATSLGLTKLNIRIIYSIPRLGLVNQGLEVSLYIGG